MGVMLFYNVNLALSVFVILSFSNWFLVWAVIELITILLISLVSQDLSPRSVEGLSKYFIINAVASVLIIGGVVARYLLFGESNLVGDYVGLPLVFVLLGLFIKLAVFPNPYWFVDVVSGFNMLRSFYIIIVSKIVPVYLYIILVNNSHSYALTLVGAISILVGSISGVSQNSIRKIVAYSSISHFGWLVIGLPWLTLEGCFFVFVCYFVMLIPILWVGGYYNIDDLNSINRVYHQPGVIILVILSLLSLGGLPPLIGFMYKWFIFLGLLSGGQYLVCGYLIVMSIISLFYYLRISYYLYSLYWPEIKLVALAPFLFNSWQKNSVIWISILLLLSITSVGILCILPIVE
uniref:NADH-ubiquinone oxidoreductase chain 2 n=1 Tax=Amphiura digitula TaxID=2588555 RepID=A0A4Y5T1A4_9ECHI|nr:NADH dehydrogenase subunit 2 [Amphiura digitula]QDA81587.1 NADH dehydrogenase subunit 2 [Amphiura digitula]QHT54245.1 NADH dehydrogenase subunit 2 [Amphiura digitula]